MSEKKGETKQEKIVAYLRENGGGGISNPKLGEMFEANEGTVRRARKVWEAEGIRDEAVANGMNGGEAMGLLKAVLAADAVEEVIAGQIEDIKEEAKSLKESLADAKAKAKEVRVAARERLPLFDSPAAPAAGPRLSSHAG